MKLFMFCAIDNEGIHYLTHLYATDRIEAARKIISDEIYWSQEDFKEDISDYRNIKDTTVTEILQTIADSCINGDSQSLIILKEIKEIAYEKSNDVGHDLTTTEIRGKIRLGEIKLPTGLLS